MAERNPFVRVARLLALSSLMLTLACSAAEEAHSPLWDDLSAQGGARGSDDDEPQDVCKDGVTKSCKLVFEQANGVKSCWVGTQTCADGHWLPCIEDDVETQSIAPLPKAGVRPLSLSVAAKCANNPCDPECMLFNEVPLSPITMPGAAPDWWEGDPQNFADGPQIKTTCTSQTDCQIDSFCDGLPTTVCSHGVCEAGSALQGTCNSCVAEVCAMTGMSYCCTGGWNAGCIAKLKDTKCGSAVSDPPFGTNICDYAIYTDGTVSVQYGTVKGGPIGGNSGSISADFSKTDGIFNHGAVSVYMATVKGNLVGDPLGFDAYATVSGTKTTATSVYTGPVLPTTSVTCPTGGADVAVATGTKQTLSPGTYGAITASGTSGTVDTTLVLQPGVYTISSLSLTNTTLELPTTGSVEIRSCGKVLTSGSMQMTGIADAVDGLRLHVYSARADAGGGKSSASIVLASDQTFYGLWDAPKGTVWGEEIANKGAKLYGLVRAAQASFSYGLVDASGLTADVCLAAGLDPTTPLLCPGAPPGECKRNPKGSVDSTCTGVDLSVAPPCADTVPICNHGATDAPSGAVLHFFERADKVGPSLTPDLTKAVGTCTASVPIPSGECRSISCNPTLLDEELAIVVNTTGAISECSLDDNWSTYVDGVACQDMCIATCPAAPATYAVTEPYEAKCPDSMSPIWGSLRWRATTPGASNITFEARSADDATALTMATYVASGTAQLPDTEVCSFTTNGPDCPVDLSAKLGKVGSKNDHLELRATLNRDGDNAPTLIDWGITYTCVYDE